MQVLDILRQKGREVTSLPLDANISDATILFAAKRIGAVVVRDGSGNLAGILSERDVVRALATESVRALAQPVTKYMSSPVATCVEADTVDYLMEMMTQGRFRHVPVLDAQNQIAGIISIGDVVKTHVEEATREASNLRQYIAAAG